MKHFISKLGTFLTRLILIIAMTPLMIAPAMLMFLFTGHMRITLTRDGGQYSVLEFQPEPDDNIKPGGTDE